jgi:CheY-like chemotaxis protein/prolyl-tRNA editing enzyme YbaK/EbsC (Cys-tRNA(Pro) deacylase)
MAVPAWVSTILHHYGVRYEERHHAAAFSAPRLAQAEHVPGACVAKTVFLAVAGKPVGVVLPAHATLDLERVQSLFGPRDSHLATEEEIGRWFKGCRPGAVPPLRLRRDLHLLMDRSLARRGKILFAAGTHEDAVAVSFRDWYRAVRPGVGRFVAHHTGNGSHKLHPIMVVEDEPDTNQLLCRLLEMKGLPTCGVLEGRQALAMAPEIQPSAILLDIMLPDMSGFEVYEQLRRTGPVKRIPVIVVTALNDEESRQQSREIGADAFLSKPFMPEALMDELQGALADARG